MCAIHPCDIDNCSLNLAAKQRCIHIGMQLRQVPNLQVSSLAHSAHAKASPILDVLSTGWAAAAEHGATWAHVAAEHLSSLQQLLRARFQSYMQSGVNS